MAVTKIFRKQYSLLYIMERVIKVIKNIFNCQIP